MSETNLEDQRHARAAHAPRTTDLVKKLAAKDAEIARLKAELVKAHGMAAFLDAEGLEYVRLGIDLRQRAETAEAQLRTVQAQLDRYCSQWIDTLNIFDWALNMAHSARRLRRTVAQQIRALTRHNDGTIPVNDGLKRNLPECENCAVVRADDLDAILSTLEAT